MVSSLRYSISLWTGLLSLFLITKIQATLSYRNGFSGNHLYSVDSVGTRYSRISKYIPGDNPLFIIFYDSALSTTGNNYNITNLALSNLNYYFAKVRCSPYNQLNATNNSFLIFTTK